MLNDLTSPATLVQTRRSGKPRQMVAPGPDAAQLERILTAASRVPDHGKLSPWRFVVIEPEGRDALAALLERAYATGKDKVGRLEAEANEQFARQAPALVVVFSAPKPESHIPVWEQQLSAGAACQALLTAATAEGFVGGWLTGWAAYVPEIAEALGHPGQQIAGFIYLGTPGKEVEERPRPPLGDIVTHWRG